MTGELYLLKNKDYQFSGFMGLNSSRMHPVLCVLDTNVGSGLIQVDVLEQDRLDSTGQRHMLGISSTSDPKPKALEQKCFFSKRWTTNLLRLHLRRRTSYAHPNRGDLHRQMYKVDVLSREEKCSSSLSPGAHFIDVLSAMRNGRIISSTVTRTLQKMWHYF